MMAMVTSETGDRQLEREFSDEELRMVVVQIRRIMRTANLEFSLRVGSVIIHHFYDGDTNAWRSRGPKVASFRQLAKHPDLPLSAGALYRCVALYELCDRLNAPTRWEHLGASHLREVLGLAPADQESMLAAANTNRWTVKDFQTALVSAKLGRIRKGGRAPQARVTKTLRLVRKSLFMQAYDEKELKTLSPDVIADNLKVVAEVKVGLESLSHTLLALQAALPMGQA